MNLYIHTYYIYTVYVGGIHWLSVRICSIFCVSGSVNNPPTPVQYLLSLDLYWVWLGMMANMKFGATVNIIVRISMYWGMHMYSYALCVLFLYHGPQG